MGIQVSKRFLVETISGPGAWSRVPSFCRRLTEWLAAPVGQGASRFCRLTSNRNRWEPESATRRDEPFGEWLRSNAVESRSLRTHSSCPLSHRQTAPYVAL